MDDKKRQTIETYDASASAMAKKFNALGARVEDIERGFALAAKENPFVVEIGCGNGRDAVEILKRTKRYLGIDVSQAMVDAARAAAPEGRFEVADIDSWAFPDGIDLVFAFASLLHSAPSDLESIMAKAAAALHEGGILYISLKRGSGQNTKTDEFGTRTYFLYTPDTIRNMAGQSLSVVYENEQDLRGQKWFTMALKKT